MIRGYKKLKVKKQKGPRGPEGQGPGGTRGQEERGARRPRRDKAQEPGKWEAQRPRGPGSHQVEFRPSPPILSSQ